MNEKKKGQMQLLSNIVKCLNCQSDLDFAKNSFVCKQCGSEYHIVDGIPRFVPEKYWKLNDAAENVQELTNKYFGFEWDYFSDWGFIKDEDVPQEKKDIYHGGTVNARKSAFLLKCKMNEDDLSEEKIVLDAGCGNGRYTYEASLQGKGLIIGADIGYGSVKSAYKNTLGRDNVLIIQADLLNLPFKDKVVDSCFSNGVLMHTGDAKKAFSEVARTIKSSGVFVAHVYNKLNPIWEFNDMVARFFTTKMSISSNIRLAKFLSKLSRIVNRLPNGFNFVNYFFRLQPSEIHMFDWYAAPYASHHKIEELQSWFDDNGFNLKEADINEYKKQKFFDRPWAVNLKGTKK